jgi:hypothetical protein
MRPNRRDVLAAGAAAGASTAVAALFGSGLRAAPNDPTAVFHPEFPSHSPADARAIVGASHTDLERVTALVTARPALAKASWDWGFGDWETALGAASHMGRPDIAGILLRHGAHPTIFSAAMLGQLDVVRAMVEASPGIQRTLGPHGITLLRHAVAGGEEAKLVVEFLESLGDADQRPETVTLQPAEQEPYVGIYSFGAGPRDRFEVTIDPKGSLRIARPDRSSRFLFALGEHAFFPGGAEFVRIRFAVNGAKAGSVSIHDPDLIVTAVRV